MRTTNATPSLSSRFLRGAALTALLFAMACRDPGSDGTAPTVLSTHPEDGARNVAIGTTIEATFSEPIDAFTIAPSFTLDGVTAVALAYDSTTFVATLTPSSNLTPNTTYTATVSTALKDRHGNSLKRDYVWLFSTAPAVDAIAPFVVSTVPALGATGVATNGSLTASFNEPMDPATINQATFTAGSAAAITGVVTYTAAGRIATLTPAVPLLASTAYTATLGTGIEDLAGNALATAYVWTFTTAAAPDTTRPTVSSVSPLQGAIGVATNSKVNATLSESIDPTTFSTTTFKLAGPGTTPVAGVISYVDLSGIATFAPASPLAASTTYTGTITTGVKDLAGNALAADFVWTFTTAAAPDTTAPTVLSTVPATGTIGVSTNSKLTATFSESMDPATLNQVTFSARGSAAIAGLVAYADAGKIATLTPSTALLASTTYTATLSTGVKDLAGNALASAFTWTFTTAAAPDTTRPLVSTVTPIAGATSVPINSKVNATFSEAIDPTTITTATFRLVGPGAAPVTGLISYVDLTGIATFAPSSPLASSATYTGTLTTGVKDLAGNALATAFSWTFATAAAPDTTAPTIRSTVPADGASGFATNGTINATFSESMDPSTIGPMTFTVSSGVAIAGLVTYTDAGRTATFTPSQTLLPNTPYTASVSTAVEDLAGNPMASTFTWSFMTAVAPDVTSPAVVSVSPLAGASSVAIDTKVSATFSESLDLGTITTASFKLTGPGLTPATGTVAYVDSTSIATFSPLQDLVTNATYTGTLTVAVTDIAGNALASEFVWTFRTALAIDATAPTVIATFPDDGDVGVATNVRVTASFSESMDPSTIGPLEFTLENGSTVAGLVTYTEVGRTATFEPDDDLLAATTYQVVVSGASDLAGNAMLAPATWTFTTGAALDVLPPTVTLTSPLDAASNVLINKKINATFSEPMDALSITTQTFRLRGPGVTPVIGTIAYDPVSRIATLVPSANLAANTLFTATVTTGAKDLAGNGLMSDYVWTFMTGTGAEQLPVDLRSAGLFAVLAGSTVSNTGPTVLNGDLGLSPGSAVVGFPPGFINGSLHVNNPVAAQAKLDVVAAFNDAMARSTGAISLPGNLGGLTFTPGLYSNSSTVMISGTGANAILTLDAQGDSSAVFIFKVSSTLTTDSGTSIVLSGGAKAANVFWGVGTSATLGTGSIFYGNLIADQSITLATGAVINGRALTKIAAVSLDSNTITVPVP